MAIYQDGKESCGERFVRENQGLQFGHVSLGVSVSHRRGESSRQLEVWIWDTGEKSRVLLQFVKLLIHRNW